MQTPEQAPSHPHAPTLSVLCLIAAQAANDAAWQAALAARPFSWLRGVAL